jgi:adenine-specific DNA-methyltransferase
MKLNELSKEQLIEMVKQLKARKKFGLVWEDKPEDVVERCKKELPVLEEVKDRAIISDENLPVNLLIEGDNYHALSVLNYTHAGKIDVIYIDPPYNTGNKDFKYNDSYVEKDDLYKHSKWLSFMNSRLLLAKSLLKEDGVILLSINENEFAQLKVLCDEVFENNNYLTTFTIKVRHEDRILKGDKDFHEVVEYLLMYRRSRAFKTIKRNQDNLSNKEYLYQVIEKNAIPEKLTMGGKKVSIFKPNEYEILRIEPSVTNLKKISIRGTIKDGNSSGRFFMKHLNQFIGINKGYLYKVDNMGNDSLGFRYFLIPETDKRLNGDYFQGVPQNRKATKSVPYPNYFDFVNEFNNVGYEGGVEFRNGKKPLRFLNRCLEIAGIKAKKDGRVIDFFAGSGTTGHAVLELNKEDGGNRKFILCTNNENGIAEEVCYPRIKKVIEGYSNVQGIPANLRYFKTAFLKR